MAACAEPVGDYRGSTFVIGPDFKTPDIVNDAADLKRFAHAAAPVFGVILHLSDLFTTQERNKNRS